MTKRISGGDPQRQNYWQDVVRRWQKGGQSVRAFCQAEGLRESAFYFWRRRLAGRRPRVRRPPQASLPRPAFLPVQLLQDHPAPATHEIEIVLRHGRAVHVRAGFDRQTLADVVAVLEAQPC